MHSQKEKDKTIIKTHCTTFSIPCTANSAETNFCLMCIPFSLTVLRKTSRNEEKREVSTASHSRICRCSDWLDSLDGGSDVTHVTMAKFENSHAVFCSRGKGKYTSILTRSDGNIREKMRE